MSRFKYTLSTAVIKRASAVIDDTPTLVCLSCGDTKKPVRTILKQKADQRPPRRKL
jgi:hypothetical protein